MVLRKVMLAGIANDENNDRILIKIVRHSQSSGEICPRRTAAKDSFHSPEHAQHLKRFTIRDVDHFVDVLDVHVRRNDFLSDSLDEVRSRFNNLSGLFKGLENRAVRICADDPDARVSLFQKATRAGNRAAGAESRYEVCNLTFSLSPELRASRSIMCFRVCRV